jgi:hypothetical protein
MADPTPTPPAETPQTDPFAPGLKTSEGKMAAVGMVLAVIATVGPPILDALSKISDTYPQIHTLAALVSVGGLLVGGLVSLGYGKRRNDIKVAIINAGTTPKGFIDMRVLFAMLCLTLLFASGCAAVAGTSADSGKVQVSKDVACQTVLSAAQADGTQSNVTTCDVPQAKDASGNCSMIAIETGKVTVGSAGGHPVQCEVSVKASAAACRQTISTTCTWSAPPKAEAPPKAASST